MIGLVKPAASSETGFYHFDTLEPGNYYVVRKPGVSLSVLPAVTSGVAKSPAVRRAGWALPAGQRRLGTADWAAPAGQRRLRQRD